MTNPQRILVVFPHPDDEAFGVSGTLAKYISNGSNITYACLTLGEMGRNMNKGQLNRETLSLHRKMELQESCEAIGIQDLRMLGYWDKTIEFFLEDVTQSIRNLMIELSPSLVISFHSEYAVHPDHNATGRAVLQAIASLPTEKRPVLHCVAFAKDVIEKIGQPDVLVDVSDFIEHKLKSITSHQSQVSKTYEEMKNEYDTDESIRNRMHTERFWKFRF